MWFRGYTNRRLEFIVLIFSSIIFKECDAITNSEFNAQIRDYSVPEHLNFSEVKTLQKQGLGLSRYASFAPVQNPVKFKDTYDAVTSGSSHARGYGFDYEDPGFAPGYEYAGHGGHHDAHDYHHYDFHDSGHHHSPGHHHGYGHHKFYDHGLGHKALLWPIAGIALLGAAAALVSNPVLLQLGVVSGKRRRRHIEDIDKIAKKSIQKWSQNAEDNNNGRKVMKKRMLNKKYFKVDKQVLQSSHGDKVQFETANNPKRYSVEDLRFIPIPLKVKETIKKD